MTKAEFVDAVQKAAKGSSLSKRETEDLVDCIFDVLSKSIKKDKRFAYPGFGTFSVRIARRGQAEIRGQESLLRSRQARAYHSRQPQN